MQTLTHQLVPTWVLQFCLFCFLEFFLVFDQKKQKTGENPQKNADPSPNSPACTYMGLAILACWV